MKIVERPMDELKPCPFCGREMKLLTLKFNGFETNLIRHADDAQIPCLLFRGFTWDGSVEETVKMWNMREQTQESVKCNRHLKEQPMEPIYYPQVDGITPTVVKEQPMECAERTKPVDYKQCVDAMLMMWMENVVTDAEYNRIMDKLIDAHMDGRF